MFTLSYVGHKAGTHDVPAFSYEEAQALKAKGYLLTPVYTEIERELPRKTKMQYQEQLLAILGGKKYSPVWLKTISH